MKMMMMMSKIAVSLLLLLLNTVAYAEIMRINCGSDVAVVDKYGSTWMSDKTFLSGTSGPYSICATTLNNSITNTELDNIYCSERYFLNNGGYKIPVSAGTWKVDLMFSEITYNVQNVRVFNVSVQGAVIESNIDLTKKYGYLGAGNISANVTTTTAGAVIDIFLKSSKENPKLNGIVLTKAMDNNTNTNNNTNVSFVPIPYYVNSGFNEAFNDSNGRVWNADKYFTGGEGLDSSKECANITDGKLYCTERFASTSGKINYKIPVQPNSTYTVKVHFAEFYFDSNGIRIFNVSVQGKSVATNLDVHALVGRRKPYIVTVPNISVTVASPFIMIDLTNVVENAKISGIEIQKFTMEARLRTPVRINAGSDKNYIDPISKNVWMADKYFNGGIVYGNTTCVNNIDGTSLGILACNERYFAGPPNTVTGSYLIPMATGRYVIKLFFAETLFPPGIRIFSVKVQGKVAIANLDISASVGKDNALIISRRVTVLETDSGITIEFMNIKENAKIDAIEIVSRRIGSLENAINDN